MLKPKRQNALTKIQKLGIIFLSFLLLVLPFFAIFVFHSNASSPYQSDSNTTASSTTATVTFSTNPTQNNFIVVMISDQDGGTINSVTDTLGNTFSNVITDTNTMEANIYIAQQTHVAGADTITVTYALTQHNITVGIAEMAQISSTTPSVTGAGHGSSVVTLMQLTSAVQPNVNDACFATGIGRAANEPQSNHEWTIAANNVLSNTGDSSFGILFQNRLNGGAAKSVGTFSHYPSSSITTKAQIISVQATNGNTLNINLFEMVLACFPETVSLTTTSTILTTTTGTALPEPANSTDLLLILSVIIVQIFFILLAFIKVRGFFWIIQLFLNMFGALMNVVMLSSIVTNPTIVYGNNSFLAPSFMYIFLAVILFMSVFGMFVALLKNR